jgi:hypothetical protein
VLGYLQSDAEPLVFSALESVHAALAIMTHHDMPKQLYREELIERIIDFSRRQITDCMAASNPTFRAIHKPAENVANDGNIKVHADIFFIEYAGELHIIALFEYNQKKLSKKKLSTWVDYNHLPAHTYTQTNN